MVSSCLLKEHQTNAWHIVKVSLGMILKGNTSEALVTMNFTFTTARKNPDLIESTRLTQMYNSWKHYFYITISYWFWLISIRNTEEQRLTSFSLGKILKYQIQEKLQNNNLAT